MPWLSAGVALLFALLVAVLSQSAAWAPQRDVRDARASALADRAETGVDMNALLKTNSEVFSGALKDATRQATEATQKLGGLSEKLERCEADLLARDEYLQKVAPEVKRLKDELREAQDALIRVESYFGAAAVLEAQRHRGWLSRALGGGYMGGGREPQHGHARRLA